MTKKKKERNVINGNKYRKIKFMLCIIIIYCTYMTCFLLITRSPSPLSKLRPGFSHLLFFTLIKKVRPFVVVVS